MRSWIAIALVAATGCGDNRQPLALTDLEAARHAAECERLVRCGLFTDPDVCTSYFRRGVDLVLPAAVAAGKIHYDPIAAERCLADLADRSCDVTTASGKQLPEACARMLRGEVPAGGTCATGRECQTGRCDVKPCSRDACCFGGCEPFVAAAAPGATCDPDGGCTPGYFCARDLTCHALSAVGETCDVDTDCLDGLACIGATELQDGNCRALPKIGEACPYQRCAEIGARCADGTCVAYGLEGARCAVSTDCSEFRVCDMTSHTCITTPSLGEPCTETCAGESWCDFSENKCRPPEPNGVPCGASGECATQYCQEGPIFDQCSAFAVCY